MTAEEASAFRLRTRDPDQLRRARDATLMLLRAAVPDALVSEVGSTAVPGVIGKGDLDFAVKVPAERFEVARRKLDAVLPRNELQFSAHDFQGYIVPSEADTAV